MSATQNIICPQCQTKISIDAVLSQQIEAELKDKYAQQEKDFQSKLATARQKLAAEQKALANEKEAQKKLVETQVKSELEKQKTKLAAEVAAENQKELDLLAQQLKNKEAKLAEAQKAELELRKQRAQLEEDQKAFELKLQRQLDEERQKIANKAAEKAAEEQHLKLAELQKQLQDANKANQELTRKLQQGSQQNQGEVLELELEEVLRSQFFTDEIKPVAKGANGADIEQIVKDQLGQKAGTLLWELKQTKAFSEGWVSKLKEDQRRAQAEVAILVTTVLPKEIVNFGFYQGIWVTDFASAKPLASALRIQLLALAREKQAAVGKDEKMEQLYTYITGTQFRQRIEAIVEAFTTMQTDLIKEKNSYQKIWAKREKQIEQVLNNTIGLHGNLEGLVGANNLPQIAGLEDEGEEDSTDNDNKLADRNDDQVELF